MSHTNFNNQQDFGHWPSDSRSYAGNADAASIQTNPRVGRSDSGSASGSKSYRSNPGLRQSERQQDVSDHKAEETGAVAADVEHPIEIVDVVDAVREGTVGTFDKLRWVRENRKWHLCMEICRGHGQVLIMDFLRRFRIVQTTAVVNFDDRRRRVQLQVGNAEAVVRSLCRLVTLFLQESQLQIHLQKKGGWMGMGSPYTEWVNADDFGLLDTYSNPIAVVAERTTFNVGPGCLRLQTGSGSDGDAAAENARAVALEQELANVRSDLSREKTCRETATRRAETANDDKRRLEERLKGVRRQLNKSQQDTRKQAEKLERVRRTVREKDTEIDRQRGEANRYRAESGRLSTKLRESESEASRLDYELERVVRENEEFRKSQATYEHERAEFRALKRNQKQLESDNSTLREAISELKGGARDLGSSFWSPKEIIRARKDLLDEYHDLALTLLEDEGGMELEHAYSLLWEVFSETWNVCAVKFGRIRDALHLDGDQMLRNVFLAKIQEHFMALLDQDATANAVIDMFRDGLGDIADDEAFRAYVTNAVRVCWALALTDKPAMEFYPMEASARTAYIGQVMDKSDFSAEFEAHPSCSVRRATHVRLSCFVLPGIRRVTSRGGHGKSLVAPCVIAKKARPAAAGAHKSDWSSLSARKVEEQQQATQVREHAPVVVDDRSDASQYVGVVDAPGAAPPQHAEPASDGGYAGVESADFDARSDAATLGETVAWPAPIELEEEKDGGVRGEVPGGYFDRDAAEAAEATEAGDGLGAQFMPQDMEVDSNPDAAGEMSGGEEDVPDHAGDDYAEPARRLEPPTNFDFSEVNAVLQGGDYEEAWKMLVDAGFDIETGVQHVLLCCPDCPGRPSLGRFKVDGEYMCEKYPARHFDIAVRDVF